MISGEEGEEGEEEGKRRGGRRERRGGGGREKISTMSYAFPIDLLIITVFFTSPLHISSISEYAAIAWR
jgi:hypothetical protein